MYILYPSLKENKSKPMPDRQIKTPISGKEIDIRELESQTRQTLEQAVKIQGVLAAYRYTNWGSI